MEKSNIGMFEIPASDSGKVGPTTVPMVYYTLNENQQAAVLGVDFETNPVEFGSSVMENGSVCRSEPMGKLSEQGFMMEARLRNSLRADSWDFETYPNPEILLLTVE